MKINNINSILVILIFASIIIPVLFSIKKYHTDKTWLVLNKKVIESATNCQREGKCMASEVNLGYLINHGYIDVIVNPETKEVIDNNSYVNFNTKEFIILN